MRNKSKKIRLSKKTESESMRRVKIEHVENWNISGRRFVRVLVNQFVAFEGSLHVDRVERISHELNCVFRKDKCAFR